MRTEAEPLRGLVDDLFDPDALRRELPPPGEPLAVDDAIVGGAGPKVLVGQLLWRELAIA